jgi:hypothetical protein
MYKKDVAILNTGRLCILQHCIVCDLAPYLLLTAEFSEAAAPVKTIPPARRR